MGAGMCTNQSDYDSYEKTYKCKNNCDCDGERLCKDGTCIGIPRYGDCLSNSYQTGRGQNEYLCNNNCDCPGFQYCDIHPRTSDEWQYLIQSQQIQISRGTANFPVETLVEKDHTETIVAVTITLIIVCLCCSLCCYLDYKDRNKHKYVQKEKVNSQENKTKKQVVVQPKNNNQIDTLEAEIQLRDEQIETLKVEIQQRDEQLNSMKIIQQNDYRQSEQQFAYQPYQFNPNQSNQGQQENAEMAKFQFQG